MQYIAKSQSETEEIGAEIARKYVPANKVFLLNGNLGAGKTAFARGFIRELTGDNNLSVSSPTFVLSNSYNSKDNIEIRHLDLYRLKNTEDAYDLDIENAFEECITLIEWPDIINSIIPENSIQINFERVSDDERKITVSSQPF